MRFRVNSLTGRTFRRNGVAFTGVPQVVDTMQLAWSEQQVAELRASGSGKGAALYVEELDTAPEPKKTTTAARV